MTASGASKLYADSDKITDGYRLLEAVEWGSSCMARAAVVRLKDIGTGMVLLADTKAVAKIGDIEYATLSAALKAVKDGETVILQQDVKIETKDTVALTNANGNEFFGLELRSGTYTIDLNGKKLSRSYSGTKLTCFVARAGSNVTIKNGNVASWYGSIFECEAEACNLVLDNLIVEASYLTECVDLENKIDIVNGKYTTSSSFVQALSGKLHIQSAEFTQEERSNRPGFTVLPNASLTISGASEIQVYGPLFDFPVPESGGQVIIEGGCYERRQKAGRPFAAIVERYRIEQIKIKGNIETEQTFDSNNAYLKDISRFAVGDTYGTLEFYEDGAQAAIYKIDFGEALQALPEPKGSLSGEFLGWFTTDNQKADIGMIITRDMVFYAVYSDSKYKVTFEGATEDESPVMVEVRYGTILRNIQEGYGRYLNMPGFVGWINKEGKLMSEDTRIVSDIRLYPQIESVYVNDIDGLEKAISMKQPYIVIAENIGVSNTLNIDYKVHLISEEGEKHRIYEAREHLNVLFDVLSEGELVLENLVLENTGNSILQSSGNIVMRECEIDSAGETVALGYIYSEYNTYFTSKATIEGGSYVLSELFMNIRGASVVINSGALIQTKSDKGYGAFTLGNGIVSILDGEIKVEDSLFEVWDDGYSKKSYIMILKGSFLSAGSGPIIPPSYWDEYITIADSATVEANSEELSQVTQFKIGPFGKKVIFFLGDSKIEEIQVPQGESLMILPEPPKDMKGDFLGWFTTDMIKAESGMPVSQNMKFYAVDSSMTYTVELRHLDGRQDVVHKNIPWGTTLKELDGIVDSYDDTPGFKGWYNEAGEEISESIRVTSDMILHPVIKTANVTNYEEMKAAVNDGAAYICVEGDITFTEPLAIRHQVTIVAADGGNRQMRIENSMNMFEVTAGGNLYLEGFNFAGEGVKTYDSCCAVFVDEKGAAGIKDCTMNTKDTGFFLAKVYGELIVDGGVYETGESVIAVEDEYDPGLHKEARLTIYGGYYESNSSYTTINNNNITYIYGGEFSNTSRYYAYALGGVGRYNFMDGCQPEPINNWETSSYVQIAVSDAKQSVTVEFVGTNGLIERMETSAGEKLPSWPEEPTAAGEPPFEFWMTEDYKIYDSESIFLKDTTLYAIFGDECYVSFAAWEEGQEYPVPVWERVVVKRKTKFGDIPQFRQEMEKPGFLEWRDAVTGKVITAEDIVCDYRTLLPYYFGDVKDFESLKLALRQAGVVKEIRIAENSVIEVTESLELRGDVSIDGNGAVLKRASGYDGSILTVIDSSGGRNEGDIKGVTFDGEDRLSDFPAIVVEKESHLKLQDCVIQNNRSRSQGGGICNEGVLELDDGVIIRNNWSRSYGGGICNGTGSYISDEYKQVKLIMRGNARISENRSEECGGGIHTNGQLEMYEDATVCRNSAERYGGGIHIASRLSVLQSGHIYDNRADSSISAGDDIYKLIRVPIPSRSAQLSVDALFKVFEKQQGRRYGDGCISNPDTMIVPLPYEGAPEPDADIIIPYKGWFADDISSRYQNEAEGELVHYQKGSSHVLDKRLEGSESDYGLKAIWYGLVVLYHPNGAAGTAYYDKTAYMQGANARVLANDRAGNIFIRPGFIFTGWNTKADGSGTAYGPEDNLRMRKSTALYAQWEKTEEVTVTYQWVSAENPTDVSVPVERNTCYKGLAYDAIPQSPTGQKYEFEGWYMNRECTKPYVDGTVLTGNLILYGVWTKKTDVPDDSTKVPVNITYQWVSVKNPTDVSVPKENGRFYKGDAYDSIPQAPTRQRYAFAGWYTDRECRYVYIDGTELVEDLILYGKWRKIGGGDSSGGGGNDPQPTDPQPTDPQPTDPQPTVPQPTDPQPVDPQPEHPVVVDRIPDANNPNSPAYIIVESPDGVPMMFAKCWDTTQYRYIYVPEDLPKTGDTRNRYAAAWFFLASGMLFVILMNDKKKKGSKRAKRG